MHAPEWICREHDVLWGAEGADETNPGCWVCGSSGEARRIDGLRPSLPEWAGYAVPSETPNTVRRPML